jgi:hypothetical protein
MKLVLPLELGKVTTGETDPITKGSVLDMSDYMTAPTLRLLLDEPQCRGASRRSLPAAMPFGATVYHAFRLTRH